MGYAILGVGTDSYALNEDLAWQQHCLPYSVVFVVFIILVPRGHTLSSYARGRRSQRAR